MVYVKYDKFPEDISKLSCIQYVHINHSNLVFYRTKHKPQSMVIGFTTTYAISAYHHYRCKFESHSVEGYSIQHYVIKFVSDLRQVGTFLWVLRFPPPIKLAATI